MTMILALITLTLGALLITPTLSYTATAVKSSAIYRERAKEMYAADAGVEQAMWQVTDGPLEMNEGDPPEALPVFNLNGASVNATIERLVGEPAPTYEITSIATRPNGSSTRIEAYMYFGNPIFSMGLASDGDIDIGKDCTVDGDIYYEGAFIYGAGFVHNGDEINGGLSFPTVQENNNFADGFKKEAMDGGTWLGNYSIPKGTSPPTPILLGPLYITGDLTVDKDNVIDFQGTIYVEGSIDVDMESEFTGSGSIIAVGSIGLAKTNDYGTSGDSIIMSLNSNIIFKKEVVVDALIYAPNGNVSFDKDAVVTGSIIGGNIVVDKAASIDFHPNPSIEVPGGRIHIRKWQIN